MNNIQKLKEISQDISILYVEDIQALREAFTAYLKRFFDDVVVSNNGLEALKEYKKREFDIIITDINMPLMDGLVMSQKVRAINPNQHIIIVSALKNIDSYAKAIQIGIDGYITKPVDYDQTNSILLKTTTHIKNAKENELYKNHLEDRVKQKTQELREHYVTDQLTGLHNRAYLDEQLQNKGKRTAILLNIDNFSIINYNFGFHIGDNILRRVATILKEFEDENFTLFRLQGDEFFFLANSTKIDEANTLATKIQDYFLKNDLFCEHMSINISFTIAIDSNMCGEILRTTSLAVQETREIGKNHIGVYNKNSEFEKAQKENLHQIAQVKEYLNDQKLTVFFQPIQDIQTKQIHKYEALARIVTDDGKIIMPHTFLRPLQISGMLSSFTKQIIELVFSFMSGKDLVININITGEDFKENYLLEYLKQKSKEHNINPANVVLEILESVSTISEASVLSQLTQLKECGYKIAIDDFGTENSNFSRLLSLKVDFIKIDGSFIKNLDTDKNSQEIVKSIVQFSHNIGCKIIAEYVHNEVIYDKIAQYHIDFAQGYYISEPKADITL